MVKKVLEGQTILPSPPRQCGDRLKAPIVRLDDGLVLDDKTCFEMPTLLLGPTGSGKSYLLKRIMGPILQHAAENNDNAFIFCAKKEFIETYKRPGDTVIAVDATSPEACWNLFRELRASKNPELAARDISKCLTSDNQSKLQPYFEHAANHILYAAIMGLYEDGLAFGEQYSNFHLYDFFQTVSLNEQAKLTWYDMAKTRPKYFAPVMDYFANPLEGGSVISEIKTIMHDCFWGSFCSPNGEFSAIETLKTGGKRVFLYYDHANASQASIRVFKSILTLLLKHVTNEENERKSYFFLDEFSLLPKIAELIDSMSLGRDAGFRLIACLQSAQLMTRHYSEEEAQALLSLFPNIIAFKVQDAFSRKILSDRYGKCLCTYRFNIALEDAQHTTYRPVVADDDFAMIEHRGDCLMSLPNLSTGPFLYHGYRKELETI